MQFEMWSFGHYLYIASPFLIFIPLYFILRNRSDKTKYIVGVVIGVISLLILIVRNIDIYINNGFDPEIIPLQVCHFGNIMVFIALVFRSKIATSVLWCLNLLAAFSSLVVADSLANYSDIWCIRAQAYIWGHLFIVLGAFYAVGLKIVRIDRKSFLYSIGVVFLLMIPAIILNSYFNDVLGDSINYFYIYNSNGVPFEFLYTGPRSQYGWFTIHWKYTLSLIGLAFILYYGMYALQKLFYIKDKTYETHHIFSKKVNANT